MECGVRVPQITSVETAIRLYYARVELSSADIRELFSCSNHTARKLKNVAREKMEQDDVPSWNITCVNTEAAFEAWGLDIVKLEHKLKRLRQLKLDQCAT